MKRVRAASRTASRGSCANPRLGLGRVHRHLLLALRQRQRLARVAEGQVPALARLDAEREANEAVGGAHRVLIVGQQLEGEAPGRAHRLDDLGEALGRRHDLVVAAAGDGALGLRPVRGDIVRVLGQASDERAELELLEQRQHRVAVVVVHPRRIEVERHVRHVDDDRGHALVVAGVLDGGGQRLLRTRRLDLVEVLDHPLERAPLADQRLRALSPMPFTPAMLSLLSPTRALKSGICSGSKPQRSRTPSVSYRT